MTVIDTSLWGEFRIEEVFTLVKGTRLKSTDRIPGNIPYVGASQFNNGVTHLIANDDAIHPGGVLTVCYNGPVGTTFYQPEPFWATDDVNVLYPKTDLSVEVLLFIAPIIKEIGSKYAYVDKWKMKDMAASILHLPVTKSGDPDWGYMEQEMRCVIEKQKSKLRLVDKLEKLEPVSVDVNAWGEFRIEDIFEIHSTLSGIDKNKLNQVPGDIPYITRSGGNNAVAMYVTDDQDPKYQKESGNVITVGLDTQTVCYQPVPFYTGQNVHTIAHEKFNVYNALFVVACIKAVLRKYNWANGATLGRLKKDLVVLPVDTSGNPDWDYMESTMKTLLDKKAADLDVLQQLLPHPEAQEVV